MELFEDETIGANAAPKRNESAKQNDNWQTYVLAVVLIAVVGTLIMGVGLPFISIISAAKTSGTTGAVVTTNAIMVAPADSGTAAGFQEINMTVDNGWVPGSFVVKMGVPVRWNIYVKSYGGCINGLSSTDLGINWQFQKVGEARTFEFTPTKAGTIYFSCLMNMAVGRIEVKDDVTVSDAAAVNTAAANNPAKRTGGCGCGGGSSCGLK